MQKCDPGVDVYCIVGIQTQQLELKGRVQVDEGETCVLEKTFEGVDEGVFGGGREAERGICREHGE